MIVNYASSDVNKLRASLNDNARVVIYNCHMFIVKAAGFRSQLGTERKKIKTNRFKVDISIRQEDVEVIRVFDGGHVDDLMSML